jgi:Flp pilus assembly pilin Flp
MSASVIFVGFGAVVLLTAISFRYETLADLMTDFALAGVLLGLGSFAVLTGVRLVKDRHDRR